MANAWIIEPLPMRPGVKAFGTVRVGSPDNVRNDFGGVILELGTDYGGGNGGAVGIDLGSDVLFDTVLVFGVNIIPGGSQFRVDWATAAQGDFTGAFTAGELVHAFAGDPGVSPGGRSITMSALPAPVLARYLHLSYFSSIPGVPVQMARVVVGRRIELERNFSFGAGFGVKDLGSLEFSRRGVLLRNRGAKLRTTALSFSSIRKDEVEQLTRPLLEQIGNTECVALVTDPAPDAQRQNRCYFGPLVGDLSQTWRRAGAWEAKINMVSIF